MLDIVVYEGKKGFIMNNIKNMNLSSYDKNYKIHKFSSYTSLLDSTIKDNNTKKIYILDDEVSGVSVLELAVKIRKYDWNSIIILVIDFDKYSNKEFKNALSDLLPQKLIPVVIQLSGINPDKKVHQVTREERNKLVYTIKNIEIK